MRRGSREVFRPDLGLRARMALALALKPRIHVTSGLLGRLGDAELEALQA